MRNVKAKRHQLRPRMQRAPRPQQLAETISRPYSAVHAEFETEMQSAEAAGRGEWCDMLRNLLAHDLLHDVPMPMLLEFSASAPSEYLGGYMVGVLCVRENPSDYADTSAEEMIASIESEPQVSHRGVRLACACMIAGQPAEYFERKGEKVPFGV